MNSHKIPSPSPSPCKDNTYFGVLAAVFLFAVVVALVHNWMTYQALYIATPDGSLYLSIADNFIKTGHFVQTARPYEVNFIAPPGLPLLIALIKGLTYNTNCVVAFQYILFGLSAVFLTVAGDQLLSRRRPNLLIALLFVLASAHFDTPNPGMVITETYTIFILCALLALFTHPRISSQRKAVVGIPLMFAAYLIRPVVSGLLVLAVGYYLVQLIRKKWSWKPLVLQLSVFALILTVNTCVNHRETGYWVMLENYGGVPMYQANNPNTKTTEYNSHLIAEFDDGYFSQIYFDETLDTQQKNELLSQRASQFMLENLGFTLKNAAERYKSFFIKDWNWNLWFMLAALAVLVWKKRLSGGQAAFLIGSFALLTIVPPFGLYISRYSAPAFPFYVLLNGSLYYGASAALLERIKGYCLPAVFPEERGETR